MPTPTSTPARRETADGLEPAGRWGGARLGRPPDALVERRQREEHLHTRPFGRVLQEVDVAHDERTARDDRERRPRSVELDEAGPREPKRPSAGWYGSVAVPSATSSRCHEGRASSRRSTSATFGLMRIERP